ncbi:MAG: HAD family phosphatase [Phycisphaerales bacterium]|nr:HAD family phosphatase [Phycisphaerales bacterium]
MARDFAVIFDMDGVLIDSERHWPPLEAGLMPLLVSDWTAADQLELVGMSPHDLFEKLADRPGFSLDKATFLERYVEVGRPIYEERCDLAPGAAALLEATRAAFVPTALASSSPRAWIEMAIHRFGLQPLFGAIVSGDDVRRGKPAPDIFLHVAAREGVEPASCLVVEDSMPGVQAALNAGMPVVRYVGGSHFGPGRPAAADNCPAFDKWPDFFDMIPSLEKETTGSARHGEQG